MVMREPWGLGRAAVNNHWIHWEKATKETARKLRQIPSLCVRMNVAVKEGQTNIQRTPDATLCDDS